MFSRWLEKLSDWTGDRDLTQAIRRELRRQRFATHAAKTREVRLVAVERPGWVQVRRFRVETLDAEQQPITLLGLARDDARSSAKIEVLLTTDAREQARRLEQWAAGLIRRG